MDKDHFERERTAHYAELHARRRERQRGNIGEPRGACQRKHGNGEQPKYPKRLKPRGTGDDESPYARSPTELREDLSYLYAELYSETDPRRREEIELEIFRMTTGAP